MNFEDANNYREENFHRISEVKEQYAPLKFHSVIIAPKDVTDLEKIELMKMVGSSGIGNENGLKQKGWINKNLEAYVLLTEDYNDYKIKSLYDFLNGNK